MSKRKPDRREQLFDGIADYDKKLATKLRMSRAVSEESLESLLATLSSMEPRGAVSPATRYRMRKIFKDFAPGQPLEDTRSPTGMNLAALLYRGLETQSLQASTIAETARGLHSAIRTSPQPARLFNDLHSVISRDAKIRSLVTNDPIVRGGKGLVRYAKVANQMLLDPHIGPGFMGDMRNYLYREKLTMGQLEKLASIVHAAAPTRAGDNPHNRDLIDSLNNVILAATDKRLTPEALDRAASIMAESARHGHEICNLSRYLTNPTSYPTGSMGIPRFGDLLYSAAKAGHDPYRLIMKAPQGHGAVLRTEWMTPYLKMHADRGGDPADMASILDCGTITKERMGQVANDASVALMGAKTMGHDPNVYGGLLTDALSQAAIKHEEIKPFTRDVIKVIDSRTSGETLKPVFLDNLKEGFKAGFKYKEFKDLMPHFLSLGKAGRDPNLALSLAVAALKSKAVPNSHLEPFIGGITDIFHSISNDAYLPQTRQQLFWGINARRMDHSRLPYVLPHLITYAKAGHDPAPLLEIVTPYSDDLPPDESGDLTEHLVRHSGTDILTPVELAYHAVCAKKVLGLPLSRILEYQDRFIRHGHLPTLNALEEYHRKAGAKEWEKRKAEGSPGGRKKR